MIKTTVVAVYFNKRYSSNIFKGCEKILEIPEGRWGKLGGGADFAKTRGEEAHTANPFYGRGMDIF